MLCYQKKKEEENRDGEGGWDCGFIYQLSNAASSPTCRWKQQDLAVRGSACPRSGGVCNYEAHFLPPLMLPLEEGGRVLFGVSECPSRCLID